MRCVGRLHCCVEESSRDRCPDLMLQIASHSCCRCSRCPHWMLCPKSWFILHNTDAIIFLARTFLIFFFGNHRNWVLPQHSILFCLRSEMVHPCLVKHHCGFRELSSFFCKLLKAWKRNIETEFCAFMPDVAAPSVHTLCCIQVLHRQWCVYVVLMDNSNADDKSRIVTCYRLGNLTYLNILCIWLGPNSVIFI
jgi:hypothetical protein